MKLFLDTAAIDEIRTVHAGACSTASPPIPRSSPWPSAAPTSRCSRSLRHHLWTGQRGGRR